MSQHRCNTVLQTHPKVLIRHRETQSNVKQLKKNKKNILNIFFLLDSSWLLYVASPYKGAFEY